MAENVFVQFVNRWSQPDSPDRLEMVFQDRLKDYGAYEIRKKSRSIQVIATVSACALAVVLALLPSILAMVSSKKPKPKMIIDVTSIEQIEEEQKEEKPQEQPKVQEPEVATQAYAAPRINPDAKEDDVINPPDDVTNASDKDRKGKDSNPLEPTEDQGGTPGGDDGDNNGEPKVADVKAKFPGGDAAFQQFVIDNFNYPTRCSDEGIAGAVTLKFVVDVTGKIVTKPIVLEETKECPEFTVEAIRVLMKSPRWIPGMAGGKHIKSWREIPIRMSLQEN